MEKRLLVLFKNDKAQSHTWNIYRTECAEQEIDIMIESGWVVCAKIHIDSQIELAYINF